MKTLEQLKKEHEEQLKQLEREIYLASLLPVPPKRIGQYGKRFFPTVSYGVTSLQEVKELFLKFDKILPITHAKNSCTITSHIEEFPEYKDSIIAEYCLKIEVSQGKGFGPCVKFAFYVEVQGEKLKIEASLPDNYAFSAQFTFKSEHRESRVISKAANSVLASYSDKTLSFYSGEPSEPSANYTYLFVADDVECTEFSNMLSMLDAIAEAFKV